ncbi:MAG: hypothetical protein WB424_04235 [Terracidiphilus sp.]
MLQSWPWPANRLSRVALAFVCAVIASVIVCAVAIAFNYDDFSRSLTSWCLFMRGAFLIIILAWVLALPFVLLISRFNGWRFWFLAVSGTLMGPALLIVFNFSIRLSEPTQKFDIVEGWKIEMVVTAISLIATALYLGILKLSTRSDAL